LNMAELLVSVRSIAEAEAALAGGADVIDIKEPLRGSLGRATHATIAGVLELLNHQVPVSAALGELAQTPDPFKEQGLTYVKWGLAGCGHHWRKQLERAAQRQRAWAPECQIVAVVYGDWRMALAPSPAEVLEFISQVGWQTLLIDTCCKKGRTLLDWMSLVEVEQICQGCHEAGIRVALAGSLGAKEIHLLLPTQPDIFAVRGAVCHRNSRLGCVDPIKVRRLVNRLARTPAIAGN
jgi:uncharacterized protein (UPF0264 family)